jgi:hypothetical protein
MTKPVGIPGDRICSFIERVEHIDEEIKALTQAAHKAETTRFDALQV